MSLGNLGKSRSASHSHAVAGLLAAELQQAHQKAITTGVPVGVVVPTNGGRQAHSRSIYILEGHDNPRVRRVANYSAEYPNAVVSVVQWPLSSGKVETDPLFTDTKFDVTTWASQGGGSFADLAFVYDGRGNLHTNGLPHFNQEYHILVSAGITYSPGAEPGGATATQVGESFTISLGRAGGVRYSKGVSQAASGLEVAGSLDVGSPAPPPTVSPNTNSKPTITLITYAPESQGALPSGASAVVESDGFLTLMAEATDGDGGPLFSYWEGTGGSFSHEGTLPMEWDLEKQRWTSTLEWRPPPNDLPGTTYELTCYVQDSNGSTVSRVEPALTKVISNYDPKVAYQPKSGGTNLVLDTGTRVGRWNKIGNKQFYSVSPDGKMAVWREDSRLRISNIDGSEARWLPMPGNIQNPSWSPDSRKILYWNLGGWGSRGVESIDVDGTNITNYGTGSGNYMISEEPRWSPLGNRILIYDNRQPYMINPDGTNREGLTGVPKGAYGLDFSPDASRVVYRRYDSSTNSYGIYTADINDNPDDGLPPTLSNHSRIRGGTGVSAPRWSPKGDQIAFHQYQSAEHNLAVMSPNGSGATVVGSSIHTSYSFPSWVK